MDAMLGKLVKLIVTVRVDWLGTLCDLLEKLVSGEGPIWLKSLKRFLRKEPYWLPNILHIDRSIEFDPTKFEGLGEGWSIVEEDKRSLALTEIDLTQVRLEHMLTNKETSIKGETRFNRLKKAKHIRLDVRVFQTLWEDQSQIPESWKELTDGNTTYIYFDGTKLRHPDGDRCVLCLYWGGGRWFWSASWLERDWRRHYPSAVLAN